MKQLILSVILASGCKGDGTATAVERHRACLETTVKYLDKTSPPTVPATDLVQIADSFCTSSELAARQPSAREQKLDELLRHRAMLLPEELEKQRTSEAMKAAAEARARAERAKQADEATKAAADARDRLEKLQRELDGFDAPIDKAVGEVAAARSEADLTATRAKLRQLQLEQRDVKDRVAAAQQAAAKAERLTHVHISDECLNDPLANGC